MVYRDKVRLDPEKISALKQASGDIKSFRKYAKKDPLLSNTLTDLEMRIKEIYSPHLDYEGKVHALAGVMYKLGTMEICRKVRGKEYTLQYLGLAERFRKEVEPPPESIKEWKPEESKDKNYGFPAGLDARYIYDGFLGEGGFGKVYRAINRLTGEKCVLKLIKQQDEIRETSFINEITTWKLLRHDNIVKFIDANVIGGSSATIYIEMEYVDGGPLSDRNMPIKKADAIMIIYRLLDALEYAHEKNIIHLDIKPSNVLLTKTGIPKLTDWGLAKFYSDRKSESSIPNGLTLEYSAPEQFMKGFGPPSVRTDIYQVGAMFYELLTGFMPIKYKSYDLQECSEIMLNTKPISLSAYTSSLEDLDRIVMKCLEKHPNGRYADCLELKNDLAKVMGFKISEPENISKVSNEETILNGNSGASNISEHSSANEMKGSTSEQKPNDTNNIVLNVNNFTGVNSNTNTPLQSQNQATEQNKVTHSVSFAVEHLRTLFAEKKYPQIREWIMNNYGYLKERKPECIQYFESELQLNLNVAVRFGMNASGLDEKIENFIVCLER